MSETNREHFTADGDLVAAFRAWCKGNRGCEEDPHCEVSDLCLMSWGRKEFDPKAPEPKPAPRKVRCVAAYVMGNDKLGCSGELSYYSQVAVVCPDGPEEVEEDDKKLVRMVKALGCAGGPPTCVPYREERPFRLGPVPGGRFVYSSDARFAKMAESLCGMPLTCVMLRDRYDEAST